MTPTPPKPSSRDIDRALIDHYTGLLDRPIPDRLDRVVLQLRQEQTVLEPEV